MDMVCGIPVSDILKVSQKLDVLGVDLKDINEFLDRDKIQLFAELKNEITHLERKLNDVVKAAS